MVVVVRIVEGLVQLVELLNVEDVALKVVSLALEDVLEYGQYVIGWEYVFRRERASACREVLCGDGER